MKRLLVCGIAVLTVAGCAGSGERVAGKAASVAEPPAVAPASPSVPATPSVPAVVPEKPAVPQKPTPVKMPEKSISTKPIPPIDTNIQPAAKQVIREPKVSATASAPTKEKLVPVAAAKPPAPILTIDDFSGANTWTVQKWENSNPGTMTVIASGDGKALKLDMGEGKSEKVAVGRQAKLDLTPYQNLAVDLTNKGEKPFGFALALMTMPAGKTAAVYYEANEVKIAPGESRTVVFPLKKAVYKTAPNWTSFTAEVEGQNKLQQVLFLVYGPKGSSLTISNVRATLE